ncbi:MAG TPA: alpha/beta hydrolase [Myxococcota bacterium]|nr:alpha/beta hydrolase [Myxococcota bacterium]MDP6241741.1 alpha/beta hydrolase [Myxococcota bacterium]MDP7300393.1 alpha/beta hydrolase [Myxococcota bacterium]HJO24155.1 alpha/beta hydrolase [Myxococcota bacterium]
MLVTGGSAAVTWSIGSRLSAPVPREIGPPPSTLPGATAVSFSSASGSHIRAWHAPGRPGQGSVVLAHARNGDRRSMLGRAEFLHDAGYSVLLFDAQAHGESPGNQTTFGHLEAFDVAAAVSFATSRDSDSPTAVLGVSQGGAAALLGPSPLPVSALVLEAVYSTLPEAVANRIAIRLGEPGRWLTPLLTWQLEPRLGVSAEALAPIGGIRNIEAPLLLVAGERDRHTTLDQSRALYRAAPEPKEMWVVPGAAHGDFHGFAPREYERRVLDFLDRTLRQTSSEAER